MEAVEEYSSEWWRAQRGMLTPWEGGPAWHIGERWPHQVKADGVRDKHLCFCGPVKPGGCPYGTYECPFVTDACCSL